MEIFKIEGGIHLKGEITPQGAKNEALQILCAVLLTPEKVTINNIPDIIDINKLITLLGNLGVKIQKIAPGSYTFQADEVNVGYLETEAFKKEGGSLRGSIMIVGPLLARFGRGYIPKPGGDKIGRRRLDTHFEGFINLGAKFRYNREDHFYGVEAPDGLTGTDMLLDEASVTGTANIVMAAVLAKGKTTVATANDIKAAEERVTTKLFDDLKSLLEEKIPKDDDFMVLAGSRDILITDLQNPKPNEPGTVFNVSSRGIASIIIFKKSHLLSLVAQLYLPSNHPVTFSGKNSKLNFANVLLNNAQDQLSFDLSGETLGIRTISIDEIKGAAVSDNISHIETYLRNRSEIASFNIKSFPGWRQRAPQNVESIQVELNLP